MVSISWTNMLWNTFSDLSFNTFFAGWLFSISKYEGIVDKIHISAFLLCLFAYYIYVVLQEEYVSIWSKDQIKKNIFEISGVKLK